MSPSRLQRGATIVTGGKPHALGGNFYQPTILANVPRQADIFKEGDIRSRWRRCSVSRAKRTRSTWRTTPSFGLAAYFYTRDVGRVFRVAEALEYGIIGINEGIISTEVAPFGGVKSSGLGREGSKYGIEDYLEIK